MGNVILLFILGFALWDGFHGLTKIASERRSANGGDGKAVISVGIFSGLILMIWGYQTAGFIGIETRLNSWFMSTIF